MMHSRRRCLLVSILVALAACSCVSVTWKPPEAEVQQKFRNDIKEMISVMFVNSFTTVTVMKKIDISTNANPGLARQDAEGNVHSYIEILKESGFLVVDGTDEFGIETQQTSDAILTIYVRTDGDENTVYTQYGPLSSFRGRTQISMRLYKGATRKLLHSTDNTWTVAIE